MGSEKNDVKRYDVDVVVMGSDWKGNAKFEELKDICEVIYLDRTEGVSTTKIKEELKIDEPLKDENENYEKIKNL